MLIEIQFGATLLNLGYNSVDLWWLSLIDHTYTQPLKYELHRGKILSWDIPSDQSFTNRSLSITQTLSMAINIIVPLFEPTSSWQLTCLEFVVHILKLFYLIASLLLVSDQLGQVGFLTKERVDLEAKENFPNHFR